MILLNPVVLSVATMTVLCLLNLNVLFALIIAAMVAGLAAGMPFADIFPTLIGGIGSNAETALSYIMLGTFAVFVNQTGLAAVLARKIAHMITGRRLLLIFTLAFLACFSQNLVPIHIAFIPILIPPLLPLMNKLKIDRRAISCALAFGLQAPYIALPLGFGLIFHNIVVRALSENGVDVSMSEVFSVLWIVSAAMFVGLLIAVLFFYNKPRNYETTEADTQIDDASDKFTPKHYMIMVAALIAVAVQLIWGSLPLGALMAIMFLSITRTVSFKDIDQGLTGGIGLMGFIAFVMLVAAGYAAVIRETGAIDTLVSGFIDVTGGNKIVGSFLMLLVGLLVTMGIGTTFGTVPILATIYCPIALSLGFSPAAIILLIGAAGSLGDAGSPASDTTLGPTSGLNADGQHNHIWDTCVPSFVFFNVPIFLVAWVLSLIL
ncbi:MAG: Na+/H+ antiporter family protein [Brevinema sp.]